MYDLIGDIHGHADELVELLERLEYREQQGVFRHPNRTAVFVGDFIDRGPRIRDVLSICRSMCQEAAALAVIGNHEFNALAWVTPDSSRPGEFLRPHNEKNTRQHQRTLEQLTDSDRETALDWFRTLPLRLDLGSLRVVHACWSPTEFEVLDRATDELGHLTPEFLCAATRPGHPVFDALECVLKGPELKLPDGIRIPDKEGHLRSTVRARWFGPAGDTFADCTFPRSQDATLNKLPAPVGYAVPGYECNEPPVFFGHYWLPDASPAPVCANAACLDYSVARRGHLVAYRFDGEATLSADRFVKVPSRNV